MFLFIVSSIRKKHFNVCLKNYTIIYNYVFEMKKINEEFVCLNCWKNITKAKKTCRNHCPYCFASLHVDEKIPWDRKSLCKWKMLPIAYKLKNWEIKILFECLKCWHKHRNKIAEDDDIENLLKIVWKNIIKT